MQRVGWGNAGLCEERRDEPTPGHTEGVLHLLNHTTAKGHPVGTTQSDVERAEMRKCIRDIEVADPSRPNGRNHPVAPMEEAGESESGDV